MTEADGPQIMEGNVDQEGLIFTPVNWEKNKHS